MDIEFIKVSEIKPYTKNAKKHPKDQVDHIANSIKEFGFRQPLVIDKDNILVIGHGRLMASKKLKLEVVPCVRADDLSEEQIKALRLADNKTNESDWDLDLLGTELDDIINIDMSDFGFDILDEPDEPVEIQEDEAPEDVETRCKLGDVWILGDHRLICGDSTDVAVIDRLMDGAKADMAFTDPPYGVYYTGGLQFKDGYVEKNNRQMIKNDDVDIYEDVFKMLSKHVNGACYIWFADTRARSLYENAEKYGTIHALIIWVKNGGYGALNANYKQKHEPCLYWNPNGTKLNFCGATTKTTIWEIKKDGVNEYHPTQKPVALAGKAIVNHDVYTVLDLFGGSGSTLIACEQLNRKCYMCELDPHYCDVIIQRWENLTGKQAELLEAEEAR